jgi:predicted permease
MAHAVSTVGTSRSRAVVPILLDLAVVLVFVVVGRDEHQQTNSLGDIVTVAAPFVIGVLVGAALAWARTRDLRAVSSGLIILVSTLVVGMLLRRFVWDRGTATTFVLVTTGFLTVGFIGWRALGRVIRR